MSKQDDSKPLIEGGVPEAHKAIWEYLDKHDCQFRSRVEQEVFYWLIMTPFSVSSVEEACHYVASLLETLARSDDQHAQDLVEYALREAREAAAGGCNEESAA